MSYVDHATLLPRELTGMSGRLWLGPMPGLKDPARSVARDVRQDFEQIREDLRPRVVVSFLRYGEWVRNGVPRAAMLRIARSMRLLLWRSPMHPWGPRGEDGYLKLSRVLLRVDQRLTSGVPVLFTDKRGNDRAVIAATCLLVMRGLEPRYALDRINRRLDVRMIDPRAVESIRGFAASFQDALLTKADHPGKDREHGSVSREPDNERPKERRQA